MSFADVLIHNVFTFSSVQKSTSIVLIFYVGMLSLSFSSITSLVDSCFNQLYTYNYIACMFYYDLL